MNVRMAMRGVFLVFFVADDGDDVDVVVEKVASSGRCGDGRKDKS